MCLFNCIKSFLTCLIHHLNVKCRIWNFMAHFFNLLTWWVKQQAYIRHLSIVWTTLFLKLQILLVKYLGTCIVVKRRKLFLLFKFVQEQINSARWLWEVQLKNVTVPVWLSSFLKPSKFILLNHLWQFYIFKRWLWHLSVIK